MMKNIPVLIFIAFTFAMCTKSKNPYQRYEQLPFGSVKPSGWLKIQMQKDLNGFVGNLDRLVPELVNDPIYGAGRLGKKSKVKDLGNLKEGDAAGEDQYKWWNSETRSNWWDGYLRNVLLLNDSAGMVKVRHYISNLLKTQDADGYLGIYDQQLRYRFESENGELWAKTTLLRGLLAYYEFTNDQKVWNAIVKAVDNVMTNYPIHQSNPFFAGKEFSGGVAHGLTFTDVCDRLYQITGNRKYLEYSTFLYENFSQNYSWEKDAQLKSIFDSAYLLQGHGVHTFEHLRPLIVAAYSTNDRELRKALSIYLKRIKDVTTITGGAIGDEWIGKRTAHSTNTGYEYCSLHELMDSYTLLFQKGGEIEIAESIERIFYNAAQGARNPGYSAIAYLKTDNSYEMTGTRNGKAEPDRKQTRYKYSPVHQDVAVCCSPNAGRITPYFIRNMWLKENNNTLVAALLGPNSLETMVNGVKVSIDEITEYPYRNHFIFDIRTEKPTSFTLKIRKPVWAKAIRTHEKYHLEDGFMVITRTFQKSENIEIEFDAEIEIQEDRNGEKAFSYGAQLYAFPIESSEQKGKKYAEGFEDIYYKPTGFKTFQFDARCTPVFVDGVIRVSLKNSASGKIEQVELIPFAKTILRQVSFE